MRDFKEPACRPCAYMRGPHRAAGHLLQDHSQGRPQGRLATSSARHAHLQQASCYCCERASVRSGMSATALYDVTSVASPYVCIRGRVRCSRSPYTKVTASRTSRCSAAVGGRSSRQRVASLSLRSQA